MIDRDRDVELAIGQAVIAAVLLVALIVCGIRPEWTRTAGIVVQGRATGLSRSARFA